MSQNETAIGLALKSAVQTMSKKKQAEMIADHLYSKYAVFKQFKPLAIGIDQDLIAQLPQYDSSLVLRVLTNHCRRIRYIKALAKGGKRFDLNNKPKGEVSTEEQAIAAQQIPTPHTETAAATNKPDTPAAPQTNAPDHHA